MKVAKRAKAHAEHWTGCPAFLRLPEHHRDYAKSTWILERTFDRFGRMFGVSALQRRVDEQLGALIRHHDSKEAQQ